jgi:hypothetical protein
MVLSRQVQSSWLVLIVDQGTITPVPAIGYKDYSLVRRQGLIDKDTGRREMHKVVGSLSCYICNKVRVVSLAA